MDVCSLAPIGPDRRAAGAAAAGVRGWAAPRPSGVSSQSNTLLLLGRLLKHLGAGERSGDESRRGTGPPPTRFVRGSESNTVTMRAALPQNTNVAAQTRAYAPPRLAPASLAWRWYNGACAYIGLSSLPALP
eukprot:scaffold2707_cov417-Prasinococcus_capsulatus_cf.AAC.19